jgi:histone acetyltransferase (RNA polymerase elongator complex component)
MPDEIDRDQEFNEQRLEEMIEQSRFKPAGTPHYPTVVSAVSPFQRSEDNHCQGDNLY